MFRMMKKSGAGSNFLIGCALALTMLEGCATWSKHGAGLEPPRKMRLAVLPVVNTVRFARIKDLRDFPSGPISDESAQIEVEASSVTRRMTFELADRLNNSYFFQTVSPDAAITALSELGVSCSSCEFSLDQLRSLGKKLNIQAVLSTRIVGYGRLRSVWVALLIGSGVVEGTVQGVAVAFATANVWAAVGVAAEEVLQETAEWGGGAFLFNRYFTPVIIQARLLSTSDGATLWSKTIIAERDRQALKKLPEEERSKRETRLRVTAALAEKTLVEKLEKRAFRNHP